MSIEEQMLARRQEIARRVARVDIELVQVKADLIAAGVGRPKDDGMRFLFFWRITCLAYPLFLTT